MRRGTKLQASALPCGRRKSPAIRAWLSAAVTHQLKQAREQVDEVEIEAQRAHDRLAAGHRTIIGHAVHFLDLLRVPGGEPGKHDDANDRDSPLKGRAREE